jgi:hypothetical protein
MLSVTVDGKTMTMGSDATWSMTAGPVLSNDEYNGEMYDARLETPGWASAGYKPGSEGTWAAVALSAGVKGFHLLNASLDSMAFAPIDVSACPAIMHNIHAAIMHCHAHFSHDSTTQLYIQDICPHDKKPHCTASLYSIIVQHHCTASPQHC